MNACSEQNVSKTLNFAGRLRRIKYGRFWLLSGRREIVAEIRELPENTGDLATPGGSLDRTLSYREHLTKTAGKLKNQNNLLMMLAGFT